MKIVVYHTGYGCESGCCGHVIESDGGGDGKFLFEHPAGRDPLDFAKDLVREEYGIAHIGDLDWENCVIVDD